MIDPAAAARRFAFRVTLSQVGPRGVGKISAADRAALLRALTIIVLDEKDEDLRQGIGADGNELAAITEATRVHRHSDMGFADPNAPVFTPAYALSRTRSLLLAEPAASGDAVEVWWGWDPISGGPWARSSTITARAWAGCRSATSSAAAPPA